jgi:hypothetical protein
MIRNGTTSTQARHFSYELQFGKIPKRTPVYTTCGNEQCINPSHLSLVNPNGIKENEERFWEKVEKTKSCWLWKRPIKSKKRVVFYRRTKENKCIMTTAARYSYELHYGNLSRGYAVLNKCRNPLCVRPSHLYVVERKDKDKGIEKDRRNIKERFWEKVNKTDTCWLWKSNISISGYGLFKVTKNLSQKNISAHRFSWELHYGPIPKGLCVCHHCDVRNCVNPVHLFLGTQDDNMKDCIKKERMNRKLTKEKVISIRKDIKDGLLFKDIARKYDVSSSMISCISRNITWKWVA